MKILTRRQIRQMIKRLAYQIWENNFEEPEILLVGINNNGHAFAELLAAELREISGLPVVQTRIRLNPANPLSGEIETEQPPAFFSGKTVILVDDVANTGRTIFYAIKPLLETLPRKVEVAVLVDRQHKSFPIRVDYVGLSLATTLLQDIDVQIREVEEWAVYLH